MEYKFRGKTVDSKKWVYGYYLVQREDSKHPIYQIFDGRNTHMVNPDSVGMWLNRTDSKNNDLYLGDIVEYEDSDSFEGEADVFKNIGVIDYCSASSAFVVSDRQEVEIDDMFWDECTKLGNIHDNPDLLGGGE